MLAGLNKATIEGIQVSGILLLTPEKLAAFTTQQQPYFSTVVLQALANDTSISKITDFSKETSDRSRDFIELFTSSQIAALLPIQIKQLSEDDFRLQWWTATQLGNMTNGQFSQIATSQLDYFDATQFSGFTPSALSAMTSAQFTKLATSAVNLFSNLSQVQIQSIPALHFSLLTADHVSRLGDKLTFLSEDQITNIAPDSSAIIATITPEQILDFSSVVIDNISGAFFSNMTNEQRNAFSVEQFKLIAPTTISSLSGQQVADLSNILINAMETLQVQALSSENQVQNIPVESLNDITVDFTDAQIQFILSLIHI